jgi:dienelactone hydrolase
MAISTRPVPYRDGGSALEGVLAWDAAASGPRPGMLLVHGGFGLDAHARGQAERYAALGFTVLACDMFGTDVRGDAEKTMALLASFRADPDSLVQRASAGIAALQDCAEADGCMAAVGFCFGGMTVITLARAGVDLRGVISMHGALATPRRAQPGVVRAKILACHGAIDPHVPMSDVAAFAEEMTDAGADWQLLMYGGAMHGFTHTDAKPGARHGVEFHAATDRRSFEAATAFLDELRR